MSMLLKSPSVLCRSVTMRLKKLKPLPLWRFNNGYSHPKLTLTLTLSLTPGLGLGLTPGKTISVQNLKRNTKDQCRRRRSGKNLYNLCRQKNISFGSDPKLTLTITLSLTLELGLGLTPAKTISVQNLKPNSKDQDRRKRSGKNL